MSLISPKQQCQGTEGIVLTQKKAAEISPEQQKRDNHYT